MNNQKESILNKEIELKATKKLSYEKPVLISYGDVRDITLGGTSGAVELGSGCTGSTLGNFDDIC